MEHEILNNNENGNNVNRLLSTVIVWNDTTIKPKEEDIDEYAGNCYLCKFRQKGTTGIGGIKYGVARFDFKTQEFDNIYDNPFPGYGGGIYYEVVAWSSFNGC